LGNGVIRFLFKAAFWLTIIVLLLPADPARRGDREKAQVGAVEAFGAAQAAVEDASEFCRRRPEACEVGSQAFQTFGQKAQHGAKLLYEFLSKRFAESSSLPASRSDARAGPSEWPGRHTLKPEDTVSPWNGPDHRAVPLPPRRPA
jgi:hypothetical protein